MTSNQLTLEKLSNEAPEFRPFVELLGFVATNHFYVELEVNKNTVLSNRAFFYPYK